MLRHNLHTDDKPKGIDISRWKSMYSGLCVIKGVHRMKISDIISGGSRSLIARSWLPESAMVIAWTKTLNGLKSKTNVSTTS
jgi:hypothetical protein